MKQEIHFSDGEKATCGAEGQAVTDEQMVTCKKCQVIIDIEAQRKKDPIVRATIFNRDLKEGQDFNFHYEGKSYHGISGAIHRIPKSVAEHLKNLSYPIKAFKENQESGQSNIVVGTYHRFMVNIIEEMTPHVFKKGELVMAEGYPGKITKVNPDGLCDIIFDDGDNGSYDIVNLILR